MTLKRISSRCPPKVRKGHAQAKNDYQNYLDQKEAYEKAYQDYLDENARLENEHNAQEDQNAAAHKTEQDRLVAEDQKKKEQAAKEHAYLLHLGHAQRSVSGRHGTAEQKAQGRGVIPKAIFLHN